jgi:hypothetical protein
MSIKVTSITVEYSEGKTLDENVAEMAKLADKYDCRVHASRKYDAGVNVYPLDSVDSAVQRYNTENCCEPSCPHPKY